MIALIVKIITLFLIVLMLILTATSLFIGLGYFIIHLFPLSLFEATVLCMATATLLMIGFMRISDTTYLLDDDEDFDND